MFRLRRILRRLTPLWVCLLVLFIVAKYTQRERNSQEMAPPSGYLEADFPRYFHQTWLGYSEMPSGWDININKSIRVNNDLEYKLWTGQKIEALLVTHYPWFLETYRSYDYPVQKSDAARYFIMHKYGGFYMDMDLVPTERFVDLVRREGLSNCDCFMPETHPYGISNGMFACKAGSPFMAHVISHLIPSHRSLIVPYLTVVGTTGPLYLTWRIRDYAKPREIRTISQAAYRQVYFIHGHGSTWHGWDAHVIHTFYPYCTKLNLAVLLALVLLLAATCWRLSSHCRHKRKHPIMDVTDNNNTWQSDYCADKKSNNMLQKSESPVAESPISKLFYSRLPGQILKLFEKP